MNSSKSGPPVDCPALHDREATCTMGQDAAAPEPSQRTGMPSPIEYGHPLIARPDRGHRALATAAPDHRRRWHGRRTVATVAWAFRGFNPHHRKEPSYYPLLAHLAQTGHILRCKNRPGNVHDSKQAVAFLREAINGLHARFGLRWPREFRMDPAFFP